jgi:hypothetical protein
MFAYFYHILFHLPDVNLINGFCVHKYFFWSSFSSSSFSADLLFLLLVPQFCFKTIMGIKKLKTFLAQNEVEPGPSALPPASHLCIDGFGFMIFVAKQTTSDCFRPDLGGCYDAYARTLTEYIQKLGDRGVTVSVFIDRYTDLPFKGAELKIRSLSKNREWMKLCYALSKAKGEAYNIPDSTTFATMMKCQFLATLKDLGITAIKCHGEAELDIARVIRIQNSIPGNNKSYFAYGDDTDFLVMAAVPYIEFGKIEFAEEQVQAPVWQRSTTAAALSLSEQKFVEYCLLLGNDFTYEYPASMMFSSSSTTIIRDGIRKPAKSLDFVLSEPEGFILCSFNERLETCLQYSRLFYNQGCDWVHDDEDDSSSDDEVHKPKEATTFRIPKRIRDMDFRHLSDPMYRAVCGVDLTEISSSMSLGERVLKLLYETPTFLNQLSRKYGFPTDQHLEALYQMLLLIHNPSDSRMREEFESLTSCEVSFEDVHWSNVVAATLYQKTSLQLIKKYGNLVSPMQIFNGKIFHALMKKLFHRQRTNIESQTITANLKNHYAKFPNTSVIDLQMLGEKCVTLLQSSRGIEDACNLPLVSTTKRISDMLHVCESQDQSVLFTKSFLESQGDVACYLLQNYVELGRRLVVYAFEFYSVCVIEDFFVANSPNSIVDILQMDYKFVSDSSKLKQLIGRAPADRCQIIIVTEKNEFPALRDVNCIVDLCHQHFSRAHGEYTPSICSLDESGRRLGTDSVQHTTPRFRLLPSHLVVGSTKEAVMHTRRGFSIDNMWSLIKSRMDVVQHLLPAGHVWRGVTFNQKDESKPYIVTVEFNHQLELDLCMHDGGGTTGQFDRNRNQEGPAQKGGVVWAYLRNGGRMERSCDEFYRINYAISRYERPVMQQFACHQQRNNRHAQVRADVEAFLLNSAILSQRNDNALKSLLGIPLLQDSVDLPPPPMRCAGSGGIVASAVARKLSGKHVKDERDHGLIIDELGTNLKDVKISDTPYLAGASAGRKDHFNRGWSLSLFCSQAASSTSSSSTSS